MNDLGDCFSVFQVAATSASGKFFTVPGILSDSYFTQVPVSVLDQEIGRDADATTSTALVFAYDINVVVVLAVVVVVVVIVVVIVVWDGRQHVVQELLVARIP